MEPATRSALRKLIRPAAIGLIVGFSVAWVGTRLPEPWKTVWGVGLPIAALGFMVWLQRDMRQMEKERLRLEQEMVRNLVQFNEYSVEIMRSINFREPPSNRVN